jgi:ribosomal RNA assembly protein
MAGASVFLKVPKERIGVVVGPDGVTKKYVEKNFSVEMQVDSSTGDIALTMKKDAQDPSLLFKAKDVVTALGWGFSPEHAFRLIRDEDAILDVIDLRNIFGKSESDIKRVKGRIIGLNGKTRRIVEELTDANVAVYGHTVCILGNIDQAQVAREAIQMLINGSQHSSVYRFLHRKRRELKKKMLELWEKPPEEKTKGSLTRDGRNRSKIKRGKKRA